jgi:hypothetical protein
MIVLAFGAALAAVLAWPGRQGSSRLGLTDPARAADAGGRTGADDGPGLAAEGSGAGKVFTSGRAAGPSFGSAGRASAGPADVADALALLALALEAGIGQDDALDRVARCSDGAVRSSLRSVTAALRWGWPVPQAWACASPVWSVAATAWHVAEVTGAPVATLVADASQRLRDDEARRVEAAIARTGVLLVLPLGLAFLPAFACTSVIPVVLALTRSVLGS